MTSTSVPLLPLTGLTVPVVVQIASHLDRQARSGRPWSMALPDRIVVCCAALRTNLTVRQIAAVFDISKSQAHRIIADLTPQLAGLLDNTVDGDMRWSWTVDGTLIPTRDGRWPASPRTTGTHCFAQILSRRSDLLVIAVGGGYRGIPELHTPVFTGGRIVSDDVWRRHRKRRARAKHCIARLKDWQILRDHRRRGRHLLDSLRAVAYLHNMRIISAAM